MTGPDAIPMEIDRIRLRIFHETKDMTVRERVERVNRIGSDAARLYGFKRIKRAGGAPRLDPLPEPPGSQVPGTVTCRRLSAADLEPDMLLPFDRRQDVPEIWRKREGQWSLEANSRMDDWDETRKRQIVQEVFARIFATGGALYGAYDGGRLAGFAGHYGDPQGSAGQYLQLVQLQVAREHRRRGIGRQLLGMAADSARGQGALALFISAHPSKETQAFYRAAGCVDAAEILDNLTQPGDVPLELPLGNL